MREIRLSFVKKVEILLSYLRLPELNIFQSKFYLYLSHIFLVRCPDKELENIRNKAAIMAAGWNLDLKNDPIATSSYRKHCGTHTFWGYKYGKKVGTMSYVFKGHGGAKLKFGNCYTRGETKVYLNDKFIRSAKSKTKNQISFTHLSFFTAMTWADAFLWLVYHFLI